MVEFAVAFPLQFFVTLALMQFSLIMVAHVLTEQAAFAAARAALVADVPQSSSAGGPVQSGPQNIQAQAKRAACYVLMPVCPTNSDFSSMGGNAGSSPTGTQAIQFVGNDDRSVAAYALTNSDPSVQNMITTSDSDDYVGAYVEFDLVLIIPVVNHWFAKLQGGNPGEFWYGPNSTGGYNASSQSTGLTTLRLRHSAFVPKPWKAQ